MRIYNIQHITVLIRENQPENVGSNGQLIADKHRGE
jgi:phenylpyruvate tautomerase PptA (4-oxalocrotonate tautomerase family)